MKNLDNKAKKEENSSQHSLSGGFPNDASQIDKGNIIYSVAQRKARLIEHLANESYLNIARGYNSKK